MKLTEKQKRFIDYYIQTANATEAAKMAGYSKKTCYSIGNENLNKPDIKAAIHDRLEELKSARTADATEVMEFITSSMRGELSEEVIVTEGSGDGCSNARIMTKQIGARDRLKAAELLAKRYGLHQPEDDTGDDNDVQIIDDAEADENENS
jgi:phage terminase small subunit